MTVQIGDCEYEVDGCTIYQAAMNGLKEHILSTYVDMLPSTITVDGEEIETQIIVGLIVLDNEYVEQADSLEL